MTDHLRRFDGDETWNRLREWTKGQKSSERLASNLLKTEGYDVDPSHPLGGADTGKDAFCHKDGFNLVAAVYFPRGQQSFKETADKFRNDVRAVLRHSADGIVFVTNQEVRLAERKALTDLAPALIVDLYHLERLTLLLNTPANYGLRLEYLSIRITEEEYLSFLANRDSQHYERFESLNNSLAEVLNQLKQQAKDLLGYATGAGSVVCFFPMLRERDIVEFALENKSSAYPAFDIQCEYIDLDEAIDPGHGKLWTRHRCAFASLYPNRAILGAIRFDLANRESLRINLWIHTRTTSVQQQFRIVKSADRILIARKTDSEDFTEVDVPEAFPGYDPNDINKLFQ